MQTVKRTYKDSLFCRLFGSEDRKASALELYNALAGTSHADPDELEITTIESMVFLGRKNDVSFLIDGDMVLFEHQSTHNPNMPLRGLHYFSKLYAKLMEQRGLDIYGTTRLKLPAPRYFVLYFGPDDRPDHEVMRLSSSFARGPADLEVTATVLNCNEGRNKTIMSACETLRDYAHLLALARAGREAGLSLDEAVSAAVDQCIEEGALADYLAKHRAEAKDMLFTIEDEERAMRVHWETVEREARQKGFDDGYSDGRNDGYNDGRNVGYSDGHSDGYSDGEAAGRKAAGDEIAANLRALGVDDSLIQKAIG